MWPMTCATDHIRIVSEAKMLLIKDTGLAFFSSVRHIVILWEMIKNLRKIIFCVLEQIRILGGE